ncbi:MAG TPA: hypothetical protein VK477_07300 [Acidobacteriota bacterium]|nr:hypothetical protein [Acidobacteriota bacterium]
MAWRIDEHVVRGEIDNRTRGRTTGRIWFVGRAEPVELELTGDCWRDLAGRRLEFVNPEPKPGLPESFAARQAGAVGDITASRKVKVLDFPLEDMHLYYKTGREMPWHWGNALYLEWISERNGRVVIETASFELKIVGEPAWEMTDAEEETQRRANGEAMGGFMAKLGEAVAQAREREGDGSEREGERESESEDEGDESDDEASDGAGRPMTEAEADAMQARSDLLADRIQARIAREGPDADYAKILEEEIERLNREHPEPEPTPEQVARNEAWLEEFNRTAKEALENPDDEGEDEEFSAEHPVAVRAKELFELWSERADAAGWVPEDAVEEHPVQELLDAMMKVHVKCAAWLNRREWPPEVEVCAATIVRLKKTREYLDDAVRALESCQEEKLLTPAQMGPMLVELVDLADDVDELIAELRARLERGTD